MDTYIRFPLSEQLKKLPLWIGEKEIVICQRKESESFQGHKLYELDEVMRPVYTSDQLQYFFPTLPEELRTALMDFTHPVQETNETLREIVSIVSKEMFSNYYIQFFIKENANGASQCDCTLWDYEYHSYEHDQECLVGGMKPISYNSIGEPDNEDALRQDIKYKIERLLSSAGVARAQQVLWQLFSDDNNQLFKLMFDRSDLPAELKNALQHYWQTPAYRKCSRLLIDKEGNIMLPDFNQLKIEMAPLPKALYLLFVKYLDGLYLFDLQKHFDEVAGYYARFSRYSDDRVEDTIRKLLDPMGEEVRNTNLTRIKKAFLDKVSDNWAKYYYVDGPRGEKKSIMLDRSLIEVETNL